MAFTEHLRYYCLSFRQLRWKKRRASARPASKGWRKWTDKMARLFGLDVKKENHAKEGVEEQGRLPYCESQSGIVYPGSRRGR